MVGEPTPATPATPEPAAPKIFPSNWENWSSAVAVGGWPEGMGPPGAPAELPPAAVVAVLVVPALAEAVGGEAELLELKVAWVLTEEVADEEVPLP